MRNGESMKSQRMITTPVFLVGLLLLGSATPAANRTETPEELRKAFSAVKSIKTDFIQKKNMRILRQPLVSEGRFFFQSPGDIRWEYTAPVRSVLLMEGDRVKRYTWRGTAYVQDRGTGLETMRMVLQDISGWLSGDFESSAHFKAEIRQGTPVRVILSPRDKSVTSFIQQVVLTLSSRPGVLKSVEIVESPDNSTLIDFENTEINVSFPKGLFQKAP